MSSVCYLVFFIELVNLFCYFEETESRRKASPTKRWKERRALQELFLNSITAENQDEKLANSVCPLWNLTYTEQLERKENHCRIIIKQIENNSCFLQQEPCILDRIVPSPVIKAYRNKDEFSIYSGVDGILKTVGFLVGKLSLGRVICVRPTNLVIIKDSHKKVAQVYEDFIRTSPWAPCLKLYDGGHWRILLVRSNEAGEVMASVQVHPANLTQQEILGQQIALKEYFFKHLPNISLFHQVCPHSRCTHDNAPFILLYGKHYLMETLKSYKFKISPDTFFQINKLGSEVLYDTLIKMAELQPNSVLLDLCSGTGVISILASKYIKSAIGIEVVPQSVRDAIYSAKLNNITNVNFLLGSVQKKLHAVMKNLDPSSDIVAVVNPGRAGLGMDVIRMLRKFTQISRLLYISCKPDSPSTINNFIGLCSNSLPFTPFTLNRAIPVDLFPQTEHVELILLFKRKLYKCL